jgi:biotin carboxylase
MALRPQPTSGLITELNFRSTPEVWGYFSVHAHGGVHAFADSQFGHLFAHGKTREAARTNMVQVLLSWTDFSLYVCICILLRTKMIQVLGV